MSDPSKIAKRLEDVIASGAAKGYACQRYVSADNPFSGLSYVACEVVYHACGGIKSGLKVMFMHTGEPEIHVYLVDASGKVVDPTAKQYPRKVDYSTAKQGSFMSTAPSKRAIALADAIDIVI